MELAKLCGIKISVVFTDLKGNIHSYSNDHRIEVKMGADIFEKKHLVKVYKYSESSVREFCYFIDVLDDSLVIFSEG